jgi:acyl-CoA thioesterase
MSDISKRQPVDILALAGEDTFAKSLGIHVIEVSRGRVVTRLVVEERHLNSNGVVQGGLTFTLADTAFGYACNSHGIMSGGIDAHIVYLEPVRIGDVLTATAAEISRSRRLLNYRVDVTRSDGALVSKLSATALITENPIVGQP